MKYDLKDKVAIVTGARRGIGRKIAEILAEDGATVVITDIDKTECEKTAEELKKKGMSAIGMKLDVTNLNDIKNVVNTTIEKYGKIDILVNNAGIFIQKHLEEMEPNEIVKEIDVNLLGTILCTKEIIPHMKKQNKGKIINIASIAGFVGFELSSIYCATKGAIVNLTRELAFELGSYRINVNAIAPGVIETDMTKGILEDPRSKEVLLKNIPYGRLGKAEDIANTARFLASDESNYITGETIVVDGGWLTK